MFMNKKLCCIFVLVLVFSSTVMGQRIAVLPFTGLPTPEANLLAGMLGTELRRNGGYEIAPRTPAIEAAFQEQSVQRSGLTDTATMSELGKGANAGYVVSAHVQNVGSKKLIAATIIDVETFQQITGEYYEYSNERQVVNYMPKLAKKLLSGMKAKRNFNLPTLAIFPLSAETEAVESERDIIAQILSIELANEKTHGVVVRTSSLDSVMKELDLQRTGFTDDATVAKIGRAINADYVLYGQITKYGTTGYMSLVVVDVETTLQASGGYDEYKRIENITKIIPKITSTIAKQTKSKKGGKASIVTATGELRPVHEALNTREGQPSVATIRNILKNNNVDAKGSGGYTAIMFAAQNGYDDVVATLIAAGANVNVRSGSTSALSLATRGNHTKVVELLKKAGATQ